MPVIFAMLYFGIAQLLNIKKGKIMEEKKITVKVDNGGVFFATIVIMLVCFLGTPDLIDCVKIYLLNGHEQIQQKVIDKTIEAMNENENEKEE